MSILTEKEIAHIAGAESRNVMEFARAIESAVLAKLAGMELPEPDDRFVFSGLDWHRATPEYFKQSQGRTNCIAAYSTAQLHQAYAQGAASQLSAEPAYWKYVTNGVHVHVLSFCPPDDAYDEGMLIPLYTRKENQ